MLTWRAIYNDGKYLPQIKKDGTRNTYADIDRYRLVRFDLIDRDEKPVYSLYLREGQRLIYRARNFVTASGKSWVVYIVGWQQTIETTKGLKNIEAINYIHPDGSISLDHSRSNLELYDIERET